MGAVSYTHLEQLRQESAAQAIEQRRAQAQSDLRDILSDMENLHEAYNRDSEKLHKTELAKGVRRNSSAPA